LIRVGLPRFAGKLFIEQLSYRGDLDFDY